MEENNSFSQSQPKGIGSQAFLHKTLFMLAVTIALVAAIWVVHTYIFTQSSGYQAVFLTNGDVYFGHLERKIGGEYIRLTNVYYLQVDEGDTSGDSETLQNASFSLIKLGNEIHGPKDAMLINRDHIMFIEDLKDDSQVVATIQASE